MRRFNIKWRWIILMLGILVFFACESGERPPKPFNFKVIDCPNDDGNTVMLQWTHFAAAPVEKYEIWAGANKDALELKTDKREIAAFKTPDTNNIAGEGLYLTTKKSTESEVPQLLCGKSDSLKNVGQKVLRYELVTPAPEYDDLSTEYVDGKYYAIIVSPEDLTKPDMTTLKGKITESAEGEVEYSPVGESEIDVAYEKSVAGKRFLEKSEKIYCLTPENEKFLKAYGKRIACFVTADTRYAMLSKDGSFIDVDDKKDDDENRIRPNQPYYYKLVAVGTGGQNNETDLVEIKPKDEPPPPLQGGRCIIDTTAEEGLIAWQELLPSVRAFYKRVKVFGTTTDDSLLESGELIAEVNPSWHAIEYFAAPEELENKIFYLEGYDSIGQTSKSTPFTANFGELSKPQVPPELRLIEPDNDKNGEQLLLIWEPPALEVSYTVKDLAIDPEKTIKRINLKRKNYYLARDMQTGEEILVKVPEDDSILVDSLYKNFELAKVEWISCEDESEPGPKILSVYYDRKYNREYSEGILQKFGFVRTKLDDEPWQVDRKELGKTIFRNISPDTHHLEVVMLKSTGKPFENPEAHFETDVDLSKNGNFGQTPISCIYEIYRFKEGQDKSDAKIIGKTIPAEKNYVDKITDKEKRDNEYNYFMKAVSLSDGSFSESKVFGPLSPEGELFNVNKVVVFILMAIFIAIAVYFFVHARSGKKFYIRPIPGIQHIDEALGRATEMGRPALFVLGLSSIGDIATLAALTVLARVAKRAAKYNTRIIVPCYNPIVYLVAQETVKNACIEAGRPDAYNDDDVFFVTTGQFAYAAAVNGIMLREKTATNFYMGMFFAEALLLAETGTRLGAIQIAGTDAVTQIPFFITTCDYTLIGEELYAASAYLSKDPVQVASLKAQDYSKALILFLMIVGIIFMTLNFDWFYFLLSIQI